MEKFTIQSHDTEFNFDPKDWSDAFILAMVKQGIKIRVDRASSGLTKDSGATDEERLAKATEVAKKLQDGIIPSGGGFGGKLSPEDYAMKEALTANKVKFEKGESVDQCLDRIAAKLAEKAGTDPDEAKLQLIDDLESTDVYKTALKARKSKGKAVNQVAALSGL